MNFRLWLEAELEDRDLETDLVKALDFVKGAASALTMKLGDKEESDFEKAFDSLGLDRDTVSELMNFVRENKGATVKELLDQMDELDIPRKRVPAAPSRPAQIPPGQFIPKQPPQPQMSPEMMPQQPPMG